VRRLSFKTQFKIEFLGPFNGPKKSLKKALIQENWKTGKLENATA
jgi:hypothetical protein